MAACGVPWIRLVGGRLRLKTCLVEGAWVTAAGAPGAGMKGTGPPTPREGKYLSPIGPALARSSFPCRRHGGHFVRRQIGYATPDWWDGCATTASL